MNDAFEVLLEIFKCLHQSFTPGSSVSGSNKSGWECANSACIVHSIFGMDIDQLVNCYNCGVESRHVKYTSFFHNINTNSLRTMKVLMFTLWLRNY